MKFKLKDQFSSFTPSQLITIAVGEPKPFVLGNKPLVKVIPPSKDGPGETVTIPVATQAQMKRLYDYGHKMIEKVESQKDSK